MKIRAALLGAALAAAVPATAQTAPPATGDPHAPGRAVVAAIGRIVTPRGVQESFEARIGGTRQIIGVRGRDRANPILLYLHGGPAAPEMPIAWTWQRPWEEYFTMVHWDQRGSGKSFPLNDPQAIAPTMTFDRFCADAIEVIELLRKRYAKRKIFVLGHSWGSTLGLCVLQRRPDLIHAYIGTGQVIDFRENERVGYDWTLAQARAAGNAEAVAELEALEPYARSGPFDIDKMTTERKWSIRYGALAAYRDNADFFFDARRMSPDYLPADRKALNDGSAYSIRTLFPILSDVSFTSLTRVEAPIFFFLGRHDHTTPSPLAAQWLDRVKAPRKGLVWFEDSAHLAEIEEPGKFLVELLRRVRPLAREGRPGA